MEMHRNNSRNNYMSNDELDVVGERKSVERERAKINPTSILASRINLMQVEVKEMVGVLKKSKEDIEYHLEETQSAIEKNVEKAIKAQKKEFDQTLAQVKVYKDKDHAQDDQIKLLEIRINKLKEMMTQQLQEPTYIRKNSSKRELSRSNS